METFDASNPDTEPHLSPEARRKRKLWRNLFIFNLCVTLLLIGFFWLPLKLTQLNEFLESSSVESGSKGGQPAISPAMQALPPVNPDLLPARSVVVDATSEEDWTYFDFSREKPVKIHDPSSLEWDMAFRRGKIITNGGATNKIGGGGILNMGEVAFDAVEEVPLREFVADTSTRTSTENPELVQWYKYNYITHKLTPRKNIYILRTADRKFVKVQFLSFYCADKQPGCIQMKYVYQGDGGKSFLRKPSALAERATPASPDI